VKKKRIAPTSETLRRMALQIGDRVVVDGFYAEIAFLGEDIDGLPAGKYVPFSNTETPFP
jgi:hypothetical protein